MSADAGFAAGRIRRRKGHAALVVVCLPLVLPPSLASRTEPVDARAANAREGSAYHEHADCLWYAARNHGFYEVQREVLEDDASPHVVELWVAFVSRRAWRNAICSTRNPNRSNGHCARFDRRPTVTSW